jgi:glycine oxidase
MRVLIAGGGVIGVSIAYHVQSSGASAVLLERDEIGGEATGASAGMLIAPIEDAVSPAFQSLRRASLALYPALIEQLLEETGTDVQYRVCGLVRAAFSEDHAALLRGLALRKQDAARGLHWVEGEALRVLEPNLSPRIIGAAFSPGDANLNPTLLTNALASAAERRGAQLQRGAAVSGFLGRRPRLLGVSTAVNDFRGDAVVLAAGPWTEALSIRLGARAPVPPLRGQMLAYRSAAVRHAIWGESGYLVPKPGGILYAGATVEDAGFRKSTTRRGLSGLRRMAAELVPALRRGEVASAWAGLRPGSPDGLPILGRLPGYENVYVAAGHSRNGILLAPVTGRLIAQLLLEGRTEIDLTPFDPGRFRDSPEPSNPRAGLAHT